MLHQRGQTSLVSGSSKGEEVFALVDSQDALSPMDVVKVMATTSLARNP